MTHMTDNCYWGRLCSALESLGAEGIKEAAEIRADMHCGDKTRELEVRSYCHGIAQAAKLSIEDTVEELAAKLKDWAHA